MSWDEIDQANLNAAGRLYEANSIRLGAEQFDSEFRCRPSTLYKPKLYPDGNQWCALFGENIQEGVCGFGDTPDKAMHDFDKAWHQSINKVTK